MAQLRGLDTPGRVFAIINKGDSFSDFLFAVSHIKTLLLYSKEQLLPLGDN